jgi:hypothetical protein
MLLTYCVDWPTRENGPNRQHAKMIRVIFFIVSFSYLVNLNILFFTNLTQLHGKTAILAYKRCLREPQATTDSVAEALEVTKSLISTA